MTPYYVIWTWAINDDCSARSTAGDPFVLHPNWGNDSPWMEIVVAEPFGCFEAIVGRGNGQTVRSEVGLEARR